MTAKNEVLARHPINSITGAPITRAELEELYTKTQYEDCILLPDRVLAMTRDLFDYLLATGGPESKTIIFCVRDRHADDIAIAPNNLHNSASPRSSSPKCPRLTNFARTG